MRGTPEYLAPELLEIFIDTKIQNKEGKFNPMKTDIYSLGIIIFELLLGKARVANLINSRFIFLLILILVYNQNYLIKN